jgi:uncharacterized protein YndB with AHSA1/START domain
VTEKAKFVYVIYIHTTPEQVWNALRDPEMTKDYWGLARNRSEWKPGSVWRHEDYEDAEKLLVTGAVLESDPPRRLVLSWVHPEDAGNGAKTSRVSFDVEPFMGSVRLTVTHEELEPDSPMLRGITTGWPAVLSSLKTMLETGAAMPMTMRRRGRDAQPQSRGV